MSLLADAPIYLLKLLHNAAQTRMYGRLQCELHEEEFANRQTGIRAGSVPQITHSWMLRRSDSSQA